MFDSKYLILKLIFDLFFPTMHFQETLSSPWLDQPPPQGREPHVFNIDHMHHVHTCTQSCK